ncbi:LysR family transcriptional regulator [Pokkaliibacter plantistimulans]|uniref:LysR family transcriptional regulator n=1 Tax=Proteobacteria bacterium 228 TaxID=2083153 RepID=A0A2S5KQL9_9PROT|nr:LysR substrate-binding domain-containing protein [Pokkaliibacter plantistimulans]PPC76983.1 LysR family transcriptional regulator [Pokkaliibacter plantistimulans]
MKKWGTRQGPLPTLNYLIALEATARLGSFRAAAEEMHLTQGAVAQQIRALEAELGCQLFDRLPRGLEPNTIGKEYVHRLRLALGIVEEATREVLTQDLPRHPDQLILSTTPAFASRWLIPRMSRLAQSHPTLSIMIDASDISRPLHGKGRVDMAIRWGKPPFAAGHARFLLPGRATPVCSPHFPDHQRWQTPADLAQVPLISDSHHNWQRWFAAYGDPGTRINGPAFSLTNLALEAAEQGLGVALVPQLFADAAVRNGSLVRVLGDQYQLDTEAGFYILTGEPIREGSAASQFVDWLQGEARLASV